MPKAESQTTKRKKSNIRYMCENVQGTTFITPDKKYLIRIDYETQHHETHHRDDFNPHHIDHYIRVTDRIKSVSIEDAS